MDESTDLLLITPRDLVPSMNEELNPFRFGDDIWEQKFRRDDD